MGNVYYVNVRGGRNVLIVEPRNLLHLILFLSNNLWNKENI